jgi:hypothetical protein
MSPHAAVSHRPVTPFKYAGILPVTQSPSQFLETRWSKFTKLTKESKCPNKLRTITARLPNTTITPHTIIGRLQSTTKQENTKWQRIMPTLHRGIFITPPITQQQNLTSNTTAPRQKLPVGKRNEAGQREQAALGLFPPTGSRHNEEPSLALAGNTSERGSARYFIESSNSFIQPFAFSTSRGFAPSGGPTIPSFSIRSIKRAARP